MFLETCDDAKKFLDPYHRCNLTDCFWFHTRQRLPNKKFELMLTRRAKAYSSSGSVV